MASEESRWSATDATDATSQDSGSNMALSALTPSAAAYLGPLKLAEYTAKFDEEGYANPDALEGLSVDELMSEFDMKKGNATVLKNWVDKRRQRLRAAEEAEEQERRKVQQRQEQERRKVQQRQAAAEEKKKWAEQTSKKMGKMTEQESDKHFKS